MPLPKITLQSANFQPAQFTPVAFTPQQEDLSLLANSLARMEERERTATEKLSAMDVSFGQTRAKLHQDKNTLDWFDKFADNYKKQVQSFAQVGDYGNAINSAVKLAGEASNDAELIGRLKTSEQYKEQDDAQRARINKGISQATYNWWKKNNQYEHNNIYDSNGKVVGAEEINTSVPYDDINFAEHALAAFKMISPEKNSRSSSSQVSTSSSVDGTGGSHSSGSSSAKQYERVRKEDILANMDDLIADLPGGSARVEQAFDVYMSELQDMNDNLSELRGQLIGLTEGTLEYNKKLKEIANQEQKIDNRNRLMSRNGSPITDYKEFYARMVTNELLAKGLAYDWETTSSSSSKSDSSHVSNNNNGPISRGNEGYQQGGGFVNGMAPYGTVKGPTVMFDTNSSEVQNGVNNSSTNISSRFRNNK